MIPCIGSSLTLRIIFNTMKYNSTLLFTYFAHFLSAQCEPLNKTNGIGSTPAQRHYVSAAQAQSMIQAAAANATAMSVSENIAVVDPSGLLVAFLRQDNAFLGSIELSMKKARTSVLFNGISSEVLSQNAQPGQPLYGIEETNGGLILFGGG
jgi:uncharacterized protein GlcG (DUF336 family)